MTFVTSKGIDQSVFRASLNSAFVVGLAGFSFNQAPRL